MAETNHDWCTCIVIMICIHMKISCLKNFSVPFNEKGNKFKKIFLCGSYLILNNVIQFGLKLRVQMHLENMFYIQGDIHVIIIIKIVYTCILFHTCICRLIPFEPLLQQLLFRKKKSLLILISFKKKISAEFSLHVLYFCNKIPQVNICQFIFILGYARGTVEIIFSGYTVLYMYISMHHILKNLSYYSFQMIIMKFYFHHAHSLSTV